jgi:hypothetical protein
VDILKAKDLNGAHPSCKARELSRLYVGLALFLVFLLAPPISDLELTRFPCSSFLSSGVTPKATADIVSSPENPNTFRGNRPHRERKPRH